MYYHLTKDHYCRWCQIPYTTRRATDKDGFCGAKCKQAHHRAYTAYQKNVTAKK